MKDALRAAAQRGGHSLYRWRATFWSHVQISSKEENPETFIQSTTINALIRRGLVDVTDASFTGYARKVTINHKGFEALK